MSCYELVKFLSMNRSQAVKVEGTKESTRVYGTKDPQVPDTPPAEPPKAPESNP